MKNINVKLPPDFSFKSTIFSHGWADLDPFIIGADHTSLSYSLQTARGKVYNLQITHTDNTTMNILTLPAVSEDDRKDVLRMVQRMFRLDEDYLPFYQLAGKSPGFSWIVTHKAGRLLRSGNLWEDMVKMLCTTNCTWRLTQIMTENLVQKLGRPVPVKGSQPLKNAFPDARTLASVDESFLRNEIKMGYRAPYLLEFALRVARREVDLKKFEDTPIPTSELYKALRQMKGFGDYAVSNLLKLLGRYDYLGADSWSRQKFIQKHNKGKPCDDKKIISYYKKFGNWSGLFFWMDVSEEWYQREKPWLQISSTEKK